MKEIKNIAVLAIISYCEDKGEEQSACFSIFSLYNKDSDGFEFPSCIIDGGSDIKLQLLKHFYSIADFEGTAKILPEQLEPCGSYSIERPDSLEIINAYMVLMDSEPKIIKDENDIRNQKWREFNQFDRMLHLAENHKEILADIKKLLLKAAMDPEGNTTFGEKLKAATISRFFPKDEKGEISRDAVRTMIGRLQNSRIGLNIHEYMHPGVAIDLVILGYKKPDISKNIKEEVCILLTYRKGDGTNGSNWEGWSLPGTFLGSKKDPEKQGVIGLETIQEAAARVAREKTGIIVQPDDILYNVRPFVHHSRMNWSWRDGSPVITLPVVLPIKYCDIISKESMTTSESRWFPIRRMLWTVNEEIENGPKKIDLRGGEKTQKVEDNAVVEVKADEDDVTSIYKWEENSCCFRTNYDWGNGGKSEGNALNVLRSPDEIGLPAADVYIRDKKLVIDYFHSLAAPHRPMQDWNYDDKDKRPELPEGTELLVADHANIIIRALQEISSNADLTLRIVCKLLKGGIFKPIEVTKMFNLFFFPWSFSQSTMHKKLTRVSIADDEEKKKKKIINKNFLIKVPHQNKVRENTYQFVDEEELDNILLNSKPF